MILRENTIQENDNDIHIKINIHNDFRHIFCQPCIFVYNRQYIRIRIVYGEGQSTICTHDYHRDYYTTEWFAISIIFDQYVLKKIQIYNTYDVSYIRIFGKSFASSSCGHLNL